MSRFLNQWRGRALHAEFDEELRFHFEARVESNERAGMSRAEAESEARRHLGSLVKATEGMHEARISGLAGGLARDLRHALRLVRRQPAPMMLAVVTLSFGIGANAAIFSLLDASLFRPLPFPSAHQLVTILDRDRGRPGAAGPTIPELLDVAERVRVFQSVSFLDFRDAQTFGGLEPTRVFAARVEPSLFTVLGVSPALGRLFTREDSTGGGPPVVVLSAGFWRRTFGGDPDVVGQTLVVNGISCAVAGVLPRSFSIDYLAPEPVDLYLPYPLIPLYTQRSAPFANIRRVFGVARLRPEAALEGASAELDMVARALVAEHPAIYRGADQPAAFEMTAQPLREIVSGTERRVLLLLWAAVGLVLVIACVNTAQLLLAQAMEREAEMAVRGALGASRGRLLRQCLAESLLLSALAGSAGALQAVWLVRALRWLLPAQVATVGTVALDVPVLLFTLGVAIVTTLACGTLPAWQMSGAAPGPHTEGRSTTGARARSRHVLVAIEVAISVVLLVGAGLVVRGLLELQRTHSGFASDGVTLMRLRGMSVAGPAGELWPTYRQYLQRVAALPDVEAIALASSPVPQPAGVEFTVVGASEAEAAPVRGTGAYSMVSGGYFSTLRIPLLQGRTFDDGDVKSRPPVAIVNAEFARHYWPGRTALQQQIHAGPGPRAATLTIVGVVGDVRPPRQRENSPQIYVPISQQDEPSVALLVKPRAGRSVATAAVKQAIWSVMPQQAVFSVQPLDDVLARAVERERAIAALLACFAALALIMSTAGVYTVVTYVTARRTREIALRRAMGATVYDVLALLAGQTFRWAVAGLTVGLGLAAAVSGALIVAVPGLLRFEPATAGALAIVYLAVVAVAMGMPALRALRLEPAHALRTE
ncbi:MAG TPA: ABC transporter permease [Vicinamibacterales bacterium]|nr:ABC transporter permease [Vicinamibacterales bacterium]